MKDSSMTTMRTVSFVEHIEVEFKGNVIPQTMLLADVDSDTANELIVGNICGDIAIFKGDSQSQPWKKITVSGMLTCLSVGAVVTPKKNNLVCMTAEGWCYVYNISSLSASQNIISSEEGAVERPILTQELPANARVMCLADIDMDGHTEMVIGYADRVVRAFRWQETTDVHGGHFTMTQKWQLAGQIGNITISHSAYRLPELMVSQPGGTFVSLKVKPSFRHVRSEGQISTRASGLRQGLACLERSGSFAGASAASRHNSSSKLNSSLHSFDFSGSRDSPGPIVPNNSDTVSTHSEVSHRSLENISPRGLDVSSRGNRGRLQKSVSDADQPSTLSRKASSQMECSSEEDLGNSVFKLTESAEKLDLNLKALNGGGVVKGSDGGIEDFVNSAGRRLSRGRPMTELLDLSFDNEDSGIMYHPLTCRTVHNENSSTFIVGAVTKPARTHADSRDGHQDLSASSASEEMCFAVSTLDGSLVLVDHEDNMLWSLQMDHKLFALAKLDITGDGREEVICCSWNGQTYIINHQKDIVRYNFPNSVAAFCAGGYSIHERSNVPSFVYATTNGRLFIYYNITQPQLRMTNLLEIMANKDATAGLLDKLNVKGDDNNSLKQLYHWCLYGKHGQP